MVLEILILGSALLLLLVLFLPFKGAGSFRYTPPSERYHEAESVLSRRLMVQGSDQYRNYYEQHPEHKEPDERSRSTPGLLSGHARLFHTGTFAAARVNFDLIESMHHMVSGTVKTGGVDIDPARASRFIARWLKQTGAHSVGFTRLKEIHLYSHKGRGPRSGEPIEKKHANAIAITVEMDHRMLQSAPQGTTVMESSEQYLRSGVLALKTAAFIREMGFEASAHIDGNYEVICPLVAVDAGLGVIGRMGLLMTPALGPRVRISVVTTDLPLVPSSIQPEKSTIHFCHICKKCAGNCPAAAIPSGTREINGEVERWRIDSEACYHFWTVSGTDCGKCIAVCPYSHSGSFFHHFIRWAVKNNLLFRLLAIKLDDLFYGRKPGTRPLPDWTGLLDKP